MTEETARTPSARRVRAATGFAVLAAAALVAAASRWADATLGGLLPMVQAFNPYATGTALVAGCVALTLAPRLTVTRAVAALCVADAAIAFVLLPAPDGTDSAATAEHTSAPITVVSSNVELSGADPGALLASLRRLDADVVVLVEADRWFVTSLDAVGAADLFPHRVVSDGAGPGATSVLSRLPLSDGPAPPPTEFESISRRIGDDGPLLLAAHPVPPLPGLAASWRRDLAALGSWARGQSGGLVVAGDFNSSIAHPGFRALCSDHGLEGCGSLLDRPTWAPGGSGPDVLRLDHVLTRDVIVEERGTFGVVGSDHRGVWARLHG